MSDTELLDAWRSGDESSGQALFKRHFSSLYRFFRNKVGDDSDDLIQRTFLAALKGIDGFRGHSSFRTYLFVIARHELYRYLRGRHRDRERFDPEHETLEGLAPSPSSDAARAELETIVLEALRRISVEWNAGHDPSCSWVPRIVLEESKDPTRLQPPVDVF